ncbi:MAG: Na+/H+ antiporter subunit D [Clostridiales Family XIII bacterium]|nr:Na+/H+ antiporter subunit D [Clostridiales Family XIII bacterium]
MSSNLPMLPILVPFISAILMLFFGKRVVAHKIIAVLSTSISVVVSFYLLIVVLKEGMLVFCASDWSAPFGIILTMDLFSCIMVILSGVIFFAGTLYSIFTIDYEQQRNDYFVLVLFMAMGVNGAFITGDIFNMFVWFEILLVSSYVLMAIGSFRKQLRETFKYMMLNILASTLFLIAVGVLYSIVGSMNMADIAEKLATLDNKGIITVIAMMFLVVFGIKGGLFPLFFWLPQSYTEPPAAVAAIFGGMLTKVGVYCLFRVFTLIFVGNTAFTHSVLLILGIATMLIGVIGAVGRFRFKSILSYHIISQVGYMIMGLGLYTVMGIAGGIFHIAHNVVVKSCLFLTQGITNKISKTDNIKEMGGMLAKYPVLGWTFLLAAFSLAGVPPFSGFFSKFILIQESLAQSLYWAVIIAVAVSFLTLMSHIKIFLYVFWGKEKTLPHPEDNLRRNVTGALAPCIMLVTASLAMGIAAQPVMEVILEASKQLMDPNYYIESVMSIAGRR